MSKSKAPKIIMPAPVAPPAPAAPASAAPIVDVMSGADASKAIDSTPDAIRKKFRPRKSLGSTGTGLSV